MENPSKNPQELGWGSTRITWRIPEDNKEIAVCVETGETITVKELDARRNRTFDRVFVNGIAI